MSPRSEQFLPVAGSQQARDVFDALRIVVIAADKASGYMEARNIGIEPVAVVTPRSLNAARGRVADRIMDTTSLTPEQRESLMPHVLPCLATSPRGQIIRR